MRNAALSLLTVIFCSSLLAAGHEVTPPVLVPSALGASDPVVATNGQNFVTLWYRDGEIYGAIADATGTRLTPADIPVMPISLLLGSVNDALTASGQDYILFWTDSDHSYLTTLAPDLRVKGTVQIAGVGPLNNVSIASSGSQILIAAYTGNIFPPAQVVAYLLNPDGTPAREPIDLQALGNLNATWTGQEFLIAQATDTGVVLHRISTSSYTRPQISTASGRFLGPFPTWAATASSGNEIVVVWAESADVVPFLQTFWSAVIGEDGTVTKQQIDSDSSNIDGGPANIVWNGEAFVATFGNLLFRLDRGGRLLEPRQQLPHFVTDAASIGTIVYGIGTDGFGGPTTITIIQSSPAIHEIRSEFASMTPASQQDPAIASDGLDFVALFREQTASSSQLTTAVLHASPAASNVIANAGAYTAASIARGNAMYLAAWADATGVYAMRIGNDGAAIDPEPLTIAPDSYSPRPDVAWNGSAFLVTWAGHGGITDALVAPDGAVSPQHVVAADGSMEPRVAWNGKLFLIVYGVPYMCPFECPAQRAATYAVRVAADGMPIDATPTLIDQWTSPGPFAARATVASDGSEFLLALDTDSGTIVLPVNTDGVSIVLGERKTIFDWFAMTFNDIRWNGSEYVIASQSTNWLALTHLNRNGDVVDRTVASAAPVLGAIPAVASNLAGDDAVVITEIGELSVPRVHVFFNSDFSAPPQPPAPPANVTAIGTPSHFTMSWDVPQDSEGTLIVTTYGPYTNFTPVGPSVHSYTFNNPSITSVVLRSFNAGGMSTAIGALLQVPLRRRPSR